MVNLQEVISFISHATSEELGEIEYALSVRYNEDEAERSDLNEDE